MNITKKKLAKIIAEEVSRHDHHAKRHRLGKLIKEATLLEGRMSEIHTMVGDSILYVLEDNPGMDGLGLVRLVQADLDADEEFIMIRGPMGTIEEEEIFAVMDDLQEDDQVWMDVEEDAWYTSNSPEGQAAQEAQAQSNM